MFSIITPTYNREQLVQNTIKSIQAQTFSDWELIIVDDGSTDDTEKIIQSCLVDKRIQYVKKEHSGPADSLNTGVAYAKGDFIVFLDSDDEAYTNWLQQANENINDDTGVVCAGAIRKLPDGKMIKEGLSTYSFYGEARRLRFTSGSLFIKRCIFRELGGYDGEMKSNIHTDLGYRLIEYLKDSSFKTVAIENEYLVQINIHNGPRIRTNWQSRREGGIRFLNKHYNLIYNQNKKEIANICSTIAFSTYHLKQRKEALKYLLKAIKCRPLHGINYLRIIKYACL